MWQKAQTATLHYTWGPANWPSLKPDTRMLTHLPLGDSGTRLQRHPLPTLRKLFFYLFIYFLILRAILLKLHIFAHLIENFPTVYGLCSCIEKNVDPLSSPYYIDHVRSSRNAISCTFEYSYYSVLRPILLKLHILARLMESFPTVYGLCSCIEMSIPLGAHA